MMTKEFLAALSKRLPAENILTDPADCWAYSYDNTRVYAPPELVCFAHSHDDVVKVVKLCNEFNIPLIARGLGSGAVGGSVPINGGLVLSLERMQTIHNIDTANNIVVAEVGATNQAIQNAAAPHGLFWAPNPSSGAFSTLGGNLASSAAGPRSLKYGTARENTYGLTAVTGLGETITTGAYTSKCVVGYDLTRLLIGSEGTLAIITEATLKLLPIPEKIHTIRALYNSIEHACEAIAAIMSQPATPYALEFMDHRSLDLIRTHTTIDIPTTANAMLLIEADGFNDGLPAIVKSIKQAANNPGLIDWRTAQSSEEAQHLWQARKSLSPLLRHAAPKKINEDIVVPVSAMPTLIKRLDKLSTQHQIPILSFGHGGNGNIHVNLLVNPDDPDELKRSTDCLRDVFALVLQLNGSLSGEHGIGFAKQAFIAEEIDATTLAYMQDIKKVFDPKGILNPSKLFPCDDR